MDTLLGKLRVTRCLHKFKSHYQPVGGTTPHTLDTAVCASYTRNSRFILDAVEYGRFTCMLLVVTFWRKALRYFVSLAVVGFGVVSLSSWATEVPSTATMGVPPGYRILFASERSAKDTLSLFSIATDGSDVKQHVKIAVNRRGEYEPSISPDGKKIAFTTYRYGGWKIAIADLDGSNVRRLTMDPQYAYDASWSPDGKRIIYRRIVNEGGAYFRGKGDIFSIDVDGTNNVNLSQAKDEHARNPAFSPDGKHIIYDAFVGDELKIILMKQNGSNQRSVSASTEFAFAPSWSPDGQWLAHLRQDSDGYVDVWRMRPDGSGAENLTESRGKNYHAIGDSIQHWQYETHWSPDGEWIAFTADYAEKGNIDIYLVAVESGKIARLTREKGADTHPFWYQTDENWN